MSEETHWLIWDGECSFCRQCVEWVRSRDRDTVFRVIPFQNAPSPPMTSEMYERSRRTVQVVLPDGRAIEAGRAVAFVFEKLGYIRLAGLMTARPFMPLTEWCYRWVARNRRWLGKLLFRKK